MNTQQTVGLRTDRRITTEELATALAIRPQTLRKRYCQTGSYFGLRPSKLPNGQLRWPADSVEVLVAGGVQ